MFSRGDEVAPKVTRLAPRAYPGIPDLNKHLDDNRCLAVRREWLDSQGFSDERSAIH